DASDTPKPEGDMPATGGAPAAGGGSPGAVHVYRPEIGSYATNLAAASTLFNTSLSDRESAESVDPVTGARSQTWARAAGGRSHGKMADGQNGYVADRSVLQLGGSVAGGSFSGTDAWRLGVMGGYGSQRSKTRSALSDYQSRGDVAGYSAGLYGSWRQDAQTRSGLYVDGWALYNRFDNTVKGDGLAKETYKSQGITASVESGFLFEVDSYTTDGGRENRFYIRPQAQVLWSGVKADGHTERGGTKVQGVGGNNVQTRLGARFSLVSSPASQRVGGAEGFLEVNWLHTPKAYGVTMDDTQALIQGSKNVVELKAGVEGNLSERLSVSANVTRQQGSQGFQDTQGSLNVKLRF
ncbi:autotransporter outer membrane beta-barrel domain-containing protein, partial [Achromobacter ruhlandii]